MSDINVTMRDFLEHVTHGKALEAWCTFVPDIEQAKGREGRWAWFGARFDKYLAMEKNRQPGEAKLSEQNGYYALGMLRQPAAGETDRRMLDRWVEGTVVVLDDVGEKSVEAQRVRDELGEPTFVIQTSKNSQQWGYVLRKPVTDLLEMSRLQKALTLRYYPNGKDPGHERAIQYLRLPGGVNNKAARVKENGGKPWPVHLVEWRPQQTHEVTDIKMALDDAWVRATAAIHSMGARGLEGGPYTDAELDGYYKTDAIFNAFKLGGMVDESRVNNGYIGVTCPWHSTHSINDDSAGYNPRERNFKCFHSHTEGTPADLDAFFRQNLGTLTSGAHDYKAMKRKMVVDVFNDGKVDPADAGPAPSKPAQAPVVGSTTLEPLDKLALSNNMPARKTICTHLARGEVTYRIGIPAVGKSAMTMAYAMAIATERPDLIGEKKAFKRQGGVVILSNEDTRAQYAKRMRAWLDHHGLGAADLKHVVYTPNVSGVCVAYANDADVVELHPFMDWLSGELRRLKGTVALVIIDTQAATFHRIEENDNGAMGQAMSLLAQWAEANNVAVEIIHHTPKPKPGWDDELDLFSARGASAAGASVRNAVGIARLKAKDEAKVPAAEKGAWVREMGVKANHGVKMPLRYWKRHIVDVKTDTGEVDGEGNRQWEPEGQPVYVYSATGPIQAFDVNDPTVLLQVIVAVRDGEDGGAADTVLKPRAATGGAADIIAAQTGWPKPDAKDAIQAALDHGYIAEGTWKNPDTRKTIAILVPTDTGRAFVADIEARALQETEDAKPAGEPEPGAG